ncbi:hypothetical protein ACFLVH_06140 [Chloroflexota bacterium]
MLATRKEATQADRLKLKLSDVSFNKFMDLSDEPEENENLIPATGEIYPLDAHQLATQLNRKRSLFEAIHLKVTADPKGYQFKFTLDGKIISTADEDGLSAFNDELKKFEEQHPDVSVKDLLDNNKLLPEDTPFAQKVNQLKQDLVTIEQTWA